MSAAPGPEPALAQLQRTLDRLEAAEQIRSALALYCHAVDLRAVGPLSDLFAPEAEFRAVNFPQGGGTVLVRQGRAAIVRVCLGLDPVELRHHLANASIDVAPDARSARTSAYFLHTHPQRMSGGLYEGDWSRAADGAWQIRRWQVTLGWEKQFPEPGYTFSESLATHARGHGLPVQWGGSQAEAG